LVGIRALAVADNIEGEDRNIALPTLIRHPDIPLAINQGYHATRQLSRLKGNKACSSSNQTAPYRP
jgi:hypothetical protein